MAEHVLVTGGAGYIGSHAVRQLLRAGYRVTVVDNLSHGHRSAVDSRAEFVVADVRDEELLVQLFLGYRTHAVLHFAADIEVGESIQNPLKYYDNNFARPLALFRAMARANVKRVVFSSTAAVYGLPERVPILETARLEPINPYGRSKMMVELFLEDFARAQGIGYATLRYFNVAGASADGSIGEAHEPESHLIPRILASALGQIPSVEIFGTDYPTRDGTCVRDYVHVEDLVVAHILALKKLLPGRNLIYNLGSQNGFTVREVIAACERITGLKLNQIEKPRRAGDPPALIASSEKIRSELGWAPQYPDLDTMVAHAWQWHKTQPKGFAPPS